MNQRAALLMAAALTAFVLVVAGGLVGGMQRATLAPSMQAQFGAPAREQAPAVATPLPGAVSAGVAQGNSEVDGLLPARVAEAIALAIVPGSRLVRLPDVVDFQGVVAYEIVLDRGMVYIDAMSGQVLSNGAGGGFMGGEYGRGEHEDDEHESHED